HPMAADAVDIDLGRGEGQPDVGGVAGVGDELGGVQHGLRGYATDVQASAAGSFTAIDQRDFHALVSGEERCGVTAGTSTKDDQLRVNRIWHSKPIEELGG